jgi:hypothetical protein
MDKIVKHRFWILLALVPPLVIFGYYKANGAIKDAITSRTGALDSALSGIPKGDGPNPTWVKAADGGLEIYNTQLQKLVDAEKVRVWTDQLPRMTWPPEMETYLPKTPQGEMAYRGEFPPEAGFTYKAEYDPDLLEALYQSIEPIKKEKDGGVSGKVLVSRSIIPKHTFDRYIIPSEAIWDAQEDLWLLQLLFDAIRNTNRPAENAAKSAVRRLNYIRLMGGDGQSIVTAMAGAAGGRMGMDAGDEDLPMAASPMAMMGRGGAGTGPGQVKVQFEPAEEFGVGFESMAGAAGAMDGGDEAFPSPMAGRAMEAMAGAGGMPGLGQKEIRYIKFTEGATFRERGFYMSVLIDQKKVADFLVELVNSDWPIRIVRFNVGPNGGTTGTGYSSPANPLGGRMMDDTDDMMMPGMLGGGGATNFGRANDGGFGSEPDVTTSGFADDNLFTAPLMSNGDEMDPRMGMGAGPAGAYGPQPMVRGDQIQSLFTHPDLVQLDVCGVITMYNPPSEALLAAVTGTPPADGSTEPPAGEATTAEPASETDTAQPAAEDAEGADPAAGAPEAGAASEATAAPEAAAGPGTESSATPAVEGATPTEPSDAPAESPAAETTVPAPGT